MRNLLRTLEEKVDPAHTALLVIDMQNDMRHPDGSFARMGIDVSPLAAIIPSVVTIIKEAEEVGVMRVYLRAIDTFMPAIFDAMYEANLSFFEKQVGDRAEDDGAAPWIDSINGEDFVEPIEPKEDDVVITKHRFGAFANTKLSQVLRCSKKLRR